VCRCPGTATPGDFDVDEIPQLVLISFEGAVDADFYKVHKTLFPSDTSSALRNPNQCPMSTTLFMSDQRTDYCALNKLWAFGHEIGLAGIAQHTQEWWRTATSEAVAAEIAEQLEKLYAKASISEEYVYGWRTPYLMNSENQTKAVYEMELEYDSSLLISKTGEIEPSTWPFTMDYPIDVASGFICNIGACPQNDYPELWQIPVSKYQETPTDPGCRHLDQCLKLNTTEDETFQFLQRHFERQYESYRIPYVITMNNKVLKDQSELINGLQKFLKSLTEMDDVWVVSMHQAIEWMKDPKAVSQMESLPGFLCEPRPLENCQILGSSEDTEDGGNDKLESDAPLNRTAYTTLIGDGTSLLIWQYVILTVAFLIILRYDRSSS